YLTVDTITVFQRDLIFKRSRNENVTRNIPDGIRTRERLRIRKVLNRASLFPEIIQLLNRNTAWVEDSAIPFSDAGNLTAVFFRKEFRSVITYVAETLEHNGLSFQPSREPQPSQVLGILKSLTDAELDPSARCFATAMNSTLRHGFTGNTCQIIDAAWIECVVGVCHPSHFTLARADVRSRNVFTGTDVAFADELRSKASRYFFNLLFTVPFWIKPHTALRSAKGHIDDGAFVRHQCCQRHDFVL